MIQRVKTYLCVMVTALTCFAASTTQAQTAPSLSPAEKIAIKRTVDAIDIAAKALESESVPVARVGLKNTSLGLDALVSAAETQTLRAQAIALGRDVTSLTNKLNAGGKSGIARNYKDLLKLQNKINALNPEIAPTATPAP